MERWNGRVALVTGASAGIGAEICRQLVKYNMKVVGCARNVQKIESISSELPGSIHAIRCDLTKEEDILSMFKEIREKYGRLDVCINNAGFSTDCPLLTGNTDEWRSMFEVNVLALCICTREAVQIMRENNIDDGQIIQISSLSAHRVSSHHYYSGTKFMVRALTEGLRLELRDINSHIRVASISPGIVETEFVYRMHPGEPERAKAFYNSLQSLTAGDIASLVVTILQTPSHVELNDILIRPVEQKS